MQDLFNMEFCLYKNQAFYALLIYYIYIYLNLYSQYRSINHFQIYVDFKKFLRQVKTLC